MRRDPEVVVSSPVEGEERFPLFGTGRGIAQQALQLSERASVEGGVFRRLDQLDGARSRRRRKQRGERHGEPEGPLNHDRG